MPRSTQPRIPFALLAACFLGSGLTGLIYELLWTRRLQLTFGSTTLSITTVLAAFMAGLGIGSYLIGRRVDRSKKDGIRIYAYLELGVGLYALVSLPLLSLVESTYAALQSWLQLSQGGATILKLVLCFPVLAFPAALMGGTLPALVRGILQHRSDLHATVGKLYGVNTAGAALGTALAGMVLIEHLGLWRSMVLAAVINLSIAGLVLTRLVRQENDGDGEREGERGAPEPPPGEAPDISLKRHLRSPAVLFCSVAVIFTGLLSMLYEVVWARLLSLVMGSSTYAFTIVLSIFLVGLAGGSLIYAFAARRRLPSPYGLTLVLLALALWVVISLVTIPSLPRFMIQLAQIPGLGFSRVLSFEALFALFILLVPTLLLGMALPMSMGIISRALGNVGRDVGGVYLANTLGAIAGSVLTGFVFIPVWGTQNTLLGGLIANLALVAAGFWAFGANPRRRVMGLAVVGILTVVALGQPAWPPLVFDSGLGYRLDKTAAADEAELLRKLHRSPTKLLSLEEGRNATISVRQSRRGVTLLVNGKPDASTGGDMLTQVVLGIVASMAHPAPKDVGVIGWGSGVTPYTVTFFPGVQRVDAIEIEPAVLRASRFFHGVNGAAERHPKMTVIFDDARSQLLTSNRSYDVIISEPSNPWMVGVSGLFSMDFYALARERMKEGGIFGQWLQLYRIDSRSVALILRTLLRSFPHVQLWFSDPHNMILLGSDRPIRIPFPRVQRVYRTSRMLRLYMGAWGPGVEPAQFYGCYLLDRETIERVIRRYPPEVMTDDQPVLEYRAVRNLYRQQHEHILDLFRAKLALNKVLPPGVESSPPALALVGASNIVKGHARLSTMVTTWGQRRYSHEPQVHLARAKAMVRTDQLKPAMKILKTLPDRAGYRAEAALLTGRILLREGKAAEAHAALEKMGRLRPTARLWYQLQAAVAMKRHDLAWRDAERLMARLDIAWDLDVKRLQRFNLYRVIGRLTLDSKQYSRGVALLTRRREKQDGELERLQALVQIHMVARQPRRAARVMDEMLQFSLVGPPRLKLCEAVYTAVGDRKQAARCRALRTRLEVPPRDPPLWPKETARR